MNEKLLEEIGLTKGEIKVYLTLLKIGETTTGKIIEYAGISSGKIYEILDKLVKKGLVSYIIKEKTKYFEAADPNRILDFLYEKEKKLKQEEEQLKKEIPLLQEIRQSTKTKHDTTLFRGFKGIQTAIFEALDDIDSREEVFAIGVRSGKKQQYNILWEKWHNQRIKRKIKSRLIFSDKNTEYYYAFKKMKLTEVGVIQGETPSAVTILGNRVLIFNYGEEPSCLSITDKEIADSFKVFFNIMWKVAKS